MRISKKILAIALSILMAVSMMPFTAFAAEFDSLTEDTVYSYSNKDGSTKYVNSVFGNLQKYAYKLYKDVTFANRIAPSTTLASTEITIDLNGHDITSNAADYAFLFGGSNGNTTTRRTYRIINTASKTSTITVNSANIGVAVTSNYIDVELGENIVFNCAHTGVVLDIDKKKTCQDSTVTINGTVNAASEYGLTVNGTIQDVDPAPAVIVNGEVNGSTAGIYAAGNADYTINGTVTGATGIYQKGGNLTVNDGAVVTGTGAKGAYVEYNSGMYSTGDAIVVESNDAYALGTTTINGGTITSTASGTNAVAEYDAEAATTPQDITVSGGTFEAAGAAQVLPASYLVEGATEDTTTGTVTQTYVAKIGTVYYETLAGAISAATASDTITLVADVTTDATIVIPADKTITLDLNGKNISGSVHGKLIRNEGNLTITGSKGHIYNTDVTAQSQDAIYNTGTLTIDAPVYIGDADEDLTNANPYNRGAAVRNYGGTTVINDGYYTNIDNAKNVYAYALINDNDGTMTVNDATVYGHNHGNIANNDGTVNVNGGTFSVDKTYNNSDYNLYVCETSVTNVTGGTFTGSGIVAAVCVDADDYVSAGINISGGTFDYNTQFKANTSTNDAVNVSGGSFSTVIPEACCAPGFVPVTEPNSQGKYEVEANTKDGMSLTLDDQVKINFYVNLDTRLAGYSEDQKKHCYVEIRGINAEEESTAETTQRIYYPSLVKATDADDQAYANCYKVPYLAAPAQITEEVTITVRDSGGAQIGDAITTSVAEYCRAIIETSNDAKLKDLAKAMMDYGKAAADKFNYQPTGYFDNWNFNSSDDIAEAEEAFANLPTPTITGNNVYAGFAYVATSLPALRLYLNTSSTQIADYNLKATITGFDGLPSEPVTPLYDEVLQNPCIDVTGIYGENLNKTITVKFAGSTLTISAMYYAKVTYDSDHKDSVQSNFARSLYFYNKAAAAYFG